MNQKAVIITPIYKVKPQFAEEVSLRQCAKLLSAYDWKIVCPKGLNHAHYQRLYDLHPCVQIIEFEPAFFKDIAAYNRLMLSADFYKTFSDYEYLLIYQTDCFVFRDELAAWCAKNYDYVGGLWFTNFTSRPSKEKMWVGGNGGFSLRKISAISKLFESEVILDESNHILQALAPYLDRHVYQQMASGSLPLKQILEEFPLNEDTAFMIASGQPEASFVAAPPAEAVRFSFDSHPKFLYRYSNRKLPFGCHGWSRRDGHYQNSFRFWRPLIAREIGFLSGIKLYLS